MPFIQINMLEGRTDDQKRALLEGVTQAAHEATGAPVETIRVWIVEMARTEMMIGGVLAADRQPARAD